MDECFIVGWCMCPQGDGPTVLAVRHLADWLFGRRYPSTPGNTLEKLKREIHDIQIVTNLNPVERIEGVLLNNAALAEHECTEAIHTVVGS